jgi:hypothetical protein
MNLTGYWFADLRDSTTHTDRKFDQKFGVSNGQKELNVIYFILTKNNQSFRHLSTKPPTLTQWLSSK